MLMVISPAKTLDYGPRRSPTASPSRNTWTTPRN